MSFENASFYQRKPDNVRAVRLTDKGHIPITAADANWIAQLRVEGRIQSGSNGGIFINTGVGLRAVYAGEWIIWHEQSGLLEALSDALFRMVFEERATEDA